MPTTGALLAGVGRVYRQHLTASPCLLIFELAAQLKPALINIERFSPDFARTLRPGWLVVPAADFDMLATFKSSMTIIAWFC